MRWCWTRGCGGVGWKGCTVLYVIVIIYYFVSAGVVCLFVCCFLVCIC